MKLTKQLLRDHGIHNEHNVSEKAGAKIYITYCPADNGRLTARYAFWRYYRTSKLDERNTSETGQKDFTVTCRENKNKVLSEAIALIKRNYGIEITDKDPFGGWHPKGTLEKLSKLIEGETK